MIELDLAGISDPRKVDGHAPDEVIALSLSRAIHEHRLPPGMKLGEDDLADVYGVSRTVVRASLRKLAHEKLVDIRRNRGAFVACPSPKEAQEVFEARELLEPRTAKEAARRAGPADAARLRQHIAREEEATRDGDKRRALYLSGQLHVEIARIAAQDTITSFIESLIARSSLVVALYWRRESALCSHHAHEHLVRAIETGQGDKAAELMQSHLVDLHTSLDLDRPTTQTGSLKQMLLNP